MFLEDLKVFSASICSSEIVSTASWYYPTWSDISIPMNRNSSNTTMIHSTDSISTLFNDFQIFAYSLEGQGGHFAADFAKNHNF